MWELVVEGLVAQFWSWGVWLVAALVLAHLVWEHRRLQRKISVLDGQLKEAQGMLARRSNLAHEIAHEIKNPITAILCSAEALDLLVGKGLEPIHRQTLRYIREYGSTLLHLISDFLDLSRAEGGLLHPTPEAVAVAPAVAAVMGVLRSSAQHKSISLSSLQRDHDRDHELTAYVDPRHLKQILFNLVHNAVKFTPVGGSVVVELRRRSSGAVVIRVCDNGPGIAAEDIATLFDGGSAGARRCSDQHGCGIGLVLSRTLVELQGGRIAVKSEVGQGAVFEVELPAYLSPANVSLKSSATVEEQPLRGQRVLLVEPDRALGQAVSQLITAWGAMVHQVSAATEAVSMLRDHRYDAVVIDSLAEESSAQELAASISAKSTTRVLVASDKGTPEGLPAECRVVQKPFNGEALLQSLVAKEPPQSR